MNHIPFQIVNLEQLPKVGYPGEQGLSFWQTLQLDGLRIRIVEYGAGYLADHWCQKGHIVYCLEGSFETIMESGESYELTKGMCYIVSDELSSHKSFSKEGVRVLIIDGDFLKRNTSANVNFV